MNCSKSYWLIIVLNGACASISASCSVYDEDLIKMRQNISNPVDATDPNWSEMGGSMPATDDSGSINKNSETGRHDASVSESRNENPLGIDEIGVCGDGKITGMETCDTAIIFGEPGSCPAECSSDDPCMTASLQGSGCSTECKQVEVGCLNDDACCPTGCHADNDNDCSARCGDGIIQIEQNEICEPAGAFIDVDPLRPDLICPTYCEDDGDPCTAEVLTGSEDNCNAVCIRSPITVPIRNDGCCPAGADTDSDNDCQSVCGNGIQEQNEACDGPIDSGCDPQCNRFTIDQYACIQSFTGLTDECRICMCTRCTAQVVECFESGDALRDENCSTVVHCGLREGCTGNSCYCGGTDPNVNCLFGSGPCVSEIEQAARSTSALFILLQKYDSNTAIGRSTTFTICHMAECLDAC